MFGFIMFLWLIYFWGFPTFDQLLGISKVYEPSYQDGEFGSGYGAGGGGAGAGGSDDLIEGAGSLQGDLLAPFQSDNIIWSGIVNILIVNPINFIWGLLSIIFHVDFSNPFAAITSIWYIVSLGITIFWIASLSPVVGSSIS
jgi:hypothetical protein